MRHKLTFDSDGDGGSHLRNPVLREADPRDLARAADELRDRTMTLEADEILPSTRLIAVLVGLVACLAVGAIVFRAPLKALLGLS